MKKLSAEEKQIIKAFAKMSFKKGYRYSEHDIYQKLDNYEADRYEIEDVLNSEYKKLAEKQIAKINKKYDDMTEALKGFSLESGIEYDREQEINKMLYYC